MFPPRPSREAVDLAAFESVVLQIDRMDNNVFNPNQQGDTAAITSLLSSTRLIDKAARRALDIGSDECRKFVQIDSMPVGQQFIRIDLGLRQREKPWPEDAANRLLTALCEQAQAAWKQSLLAAAAGYEASIKQAEEEKEALLKKQAEVRAKLLQAQATLGSELQNGTDPNFTVRQLESQVSGQMQQIKRMKSRLASLENVSDERVKEWQQLVKLREAKLESLRKNPSAEKAEDIAEAELKVAEARTKLADVQQGEMPANERANRQGESRQLRQQIAEQESMLEPSSERLAKLTKPESLALLAEFPTLRNEEQGFFQELQMIDQTLKRLRQAARVRPTVTITVLDGGDLPAERKRQE